MIIVLMVKEMRLTKMVMLIKMVVEVIKIVMMLSDLRRPLTTCLVLGKFFDGRKENMQ